MLHVLFRFFVLRGVEGSNITDQSLFLVFFLLFHVISLLLVFLMTVFVHAPQGAVTNALNSLNLFSISCVK